MITIDGDAITIRDAQGREERIGLGTAEGFKLLSKLWLRSGWDTKYVYGFTWMGRPIIQLPEDMFRVQEVIYRVKPDVVIETGIAHGGGLVYYASLLHAMGKGRVIGVDVEIRSKNREAIQSHEMYRLITMIEGSSIEEKTLSQVRANVRDGETAVVILDSNHTRAHVLAELRSYSEFVGVGSYIVACDGIMKDLAGAPRTKPEWNADNPQSAVEDFLAENRRFVLEEPAFPFNEGQITERVTYWPRSFLLRIE